ncbi:Wadjet anti-phage system protein JetD domain-containing protein [Nocardiopsis sp. NRRL B-16309]|uniref:Wadjet anti-phage system protein JetD domain-containing protein n=1 Tax=Nocardiopsis sp. NRRL B-16309 TaxID=1519494 RepID=UPI0018D14339|nr:Wadjet anti-phage system protein JetD domain-containing protein [Nocardiopsis sp. NRRL B-16309]
MHLVDVQDLIASPVPDGVRVVVRCPEGKGAPQKFGTLDFSTVFLVAENPPDEFANPDGLESRDLAWVLEKPSRKLKTVQDRWGSRANDVLNELIRSGAVMVKARVNMRDLRIKRYLQIIRTPLWSERADERRRELLGRIDPGQARTGLLDLMQGISELETERDLLLNSEPGAVPEGSATRAGHWDTYDFAVRVACRWYKHGGDRHPTRREVSSRSHAHTSGTKTRWTDARIHAVENLLRKYISELFDFPDHEIRVKGPLRWYKDDVPAVDAVTAEPWAGLPSNGVRETGTLEQVKGIRGVLVLENQDTFYRSCQIPAITEGWVCVWGAGYASDGLVGFLRMLAPLPIAVWGDLDAHGIAIIANLRDRVERDVYPVAMTAEAWLGGPHRPQPPERREQDAKKAAGLLDQAPDALRPVAALIADHPELAGLGVEQEAQHTEVLPGLADLLAGVLDSVHSPSGA